MSEHAPFTFGGLTEGGWLATPHALIMHASKVGLTDSLLRTVMSILRFQWYDDKLPYPTLSKIAEVAEKSKRTVTDHVRKLRKIGLVITRPKWEGGPNEYDFRPLFDRLKRVLNSTDDSRDSERGDPPRESCDQSTRTTQKTKRSSNEERASTAEFPISHIEQRDAAMVKQKKVKLSGSSPAERAKKFVEEKNKEAQRKRRTRKPARTGPVPISELSYPDDVEDYNARHIHKLFAETFDAAPALEGTTRPRWCARYSAHAKELIEWYGAELTVRCIKSLLEDWPMWKRDLDLNGSPSMRLLYGFRETIFAEVEGGGATKSAPKTGGAEWNPTQEELDAPAIGWPELD